MTKIEWTRNADGTQGKTWNPLSGCSRKSAGCEKCYAEKMTKRLAAMGQAKYDGLLNEQGRFNGTIKFDEKALLIPLKTKKPTTYFVNSMSDLFHENVKDEWIDKIFAVMALCPQHTFQILTKRAGQMRDYLNNAETRFRIGDEIIGVCNLRSGNPYDPCVSANYIIEAEDKGILGETKNGYDYLKTFPLNNVWLGVSVENQKAADERIPLLLETPAAVRFLSCEPLLEEINLRPYLPFCLRHGIPEDIMDCLGAGHEGSDWRGPDWVIVGGESGPGARVCNVEWVRSIVDQCKAAKVPVFVKQLGKHPFETAGAEDAEYWERFLKIKNKKGGDINEFPADLRIREMPEFRPSL